MVNGIFNRWNGASDTLGVGDLLVGVKWYIEVDLQSPNCQFNATQSISGTNWAELTRIKTRLPFRSTSVMESLLERDILGSLHV
jgi:hypothetical protein